MKRIADRVSYPDTRRNLEIKNPSIFSILGPIMIGPSSSHVAGAVKLGLLARAILGRQPDSVDIYLHGSFRTTGKGHGTYDALVAGLLLPGCTIADTRIPNAVSIAKQQGIPVWFHDDRDLGRGYHPNTVKFSLQAGSEKKEIVGSSLGGGRAIIVEIDNFKNLENMEITGEGDSLVIFCGDRKGVIADVTGTIRAKGINIGSLHFRREKIGGKALLVLTVDKPLSSSVLHHIQSIQTIHKVLVIERFIT